MKTKTLVMITLALAVSSALLSGCASTSTLDAGSASDADAAIASSSATLIVHGMSCPLCANNVDKQLLAVPGVRSVNVDMGTGEVTVAIESGARVTRAQLAKAVDDSGFTLAEVRIP